MAGNQAEISVIRSYLDTVIGLPWHTFTKDDLNQAHARKVLDHDHYGLEKVKERILEILAVRSSTPKSRVKSSAWSALRVSAKPPLRAPLPPAWTATLPA